MDERFSKLTAKIELLKNKRDQLEALSVTKIAKAVIAMSQKGTDLQILSGLILHAPELIQAAPDKGEAWRDAGRKFLGRSRSRRPGVQAEKDQSADPSASPPKRTPSA